MAGQSGIEQGLAVTMLVTAAYCAARLVVPRLRGAVVGAQDSDAVHVMMALAMGAMLLGVGAPLWSGPLVLAFAVPAVWFAARAVRVLRTPQGAPGGMTHCTGGVLGHAHLSIAGVAMVFMSGALPGFGSMSSSSGSEAASTLAPLSHGSGHGSGVTGVTGAVPTVDFPLAGALLFGLLAVLAFGSLKDLVASADSATARADQPPWPRRLTLCCQLAMAATMAHMLASMV